MNGYNGIWGMSADGKNRSPLVPQGGDSNKSIVSDSFPISRDGTKLAFVRDPSGETRLGVIYSMMLDGSDPVELVRGGTAPAWSPDGSKLAFVGDKEGHGIYIVDSSWESYQNAQYRRCRRPRHGCGSISHLVSG